MLHQGRGIYDELFTLSQFSRSSEYSVVDGGGASMVCLHRSIQVTCMPTLGCHVYAYLGGLPYNYAYAITHICPSISPSMPSVRMGIRHLFFRTGVGLNPARTSLLARD